jgi:hypothetical protein
VSFDSQKAHKSRAGKAVLVGAFALLASNQKDQTEITVTLKDGTNVFYLFDKVPAIKVRAKVEPIMRAAGVASSDDEAPAPVAPDDVPAKLRALAEMHTSGALTDEEFTAAKTQLLS